MAESRMTPRHIEPRGLFRKRRRGINYAPGISQVHEEIRLANWWSAMVNGQVSNAF
jgi:hypothetical protein